MKKISLFLAAAFFLSAAFAQPAIEGTWMGRLTVSTTSLRLVFHLKKDGGSYAATMDSPDQGAKGIAASSVRATGDSLFVEIAVAHATFAGRFTSDSTISGHWMQGTATLPLDIKKLPPSETVAEAKRPQTPKPPFPYNSNNVVYTSKDKGIQYGATITSPKGSGPFAAVLLLTGSGQQNRDEEILGHKPFAVIADYLTRKGYVVMRVDDRGVGQTTGDVANATTKDFASDAMTNLDYLKALPQVDKKKIGLLGHSEGGMIAQLVSAQRSDVDFVIMMAGPGEKIIDLMGEQNKAVLQNSGLSSAAIDAYVDLYKSIGIAIASAQTDSAAMKAARPLLTNWMAKTPTDVVVATTHIQTDANKTEVLSSFVNTFRGPWFRYFIQYDPQVYVQKMKAKVLALNGDKDIQVVSSSNLAALKEALTKGGNKHFELIELNGLNHLFQHCQKCTVAEYGELEETVAPEALDAIGKWMEKNVK